ncbi:MAG: 30S ribosomal protein S20 [bacterium]
MPLLKSAKKRMKQDQKKRLRNQTVKKQTKTSIKKLKELIDEGKKNEAKESLPHVLSLIDQTVAKGVWPKNKAARIKSRLMKRLS